jgi:hypothetical protein
MSDAICLCDAYAPHKRPGRGCPIHGIDKRYTTDELEALPVLHQGQADDCHIEIRDGARSLRVWLSRTGVADGEPFDNTVTHEHLIDGRWETVLVYNGAAARELVEES